MLMCSKMMGGESEVRNPIIGYNFNGQTLDQYGTLNQTLYGGATITGDKLNVTANGQYAQALDPTGIASFGSGAFSISGKIKISTLNTQKYICAKRNTNEAFGDSSKFEYRLIIDANNKLNILLVDTNATSNALLNAVSAQTFAANIDYKIAITFGGGVGNFFKMYVDGMLISHTYTATGSYLQMRSTGSYLMLGNYKVDPILPLLGSLDDLKLFNVELTADEVAAL